MMKISPHIMSAYVHFEFEKSKNDLLNYYSDHWMFNSCVHSCVSAICGCCVKQPGPQYLFRGEQLKIKAEKVSDPEEINWESLDVGTCSKITRIIFAFIIIIVFIAVCSTLVSLCSIFINVNSINCDGVNIPTEAQVAATANTTEVTCFCNSNLFSFSDGTIQNICKEIFKQLYIENGLQIAAAVISTVTNFLFAIISKKIIDFTKPNSYSSGLVTKTIVLFIFLFLNTCVLPLLIYADVYGFKISSYVSLIKLINPNIAFFNMDAFTYYDDFTNIWYRNVSPYFVNFLVINLIMVWVMFAVKSIGNSCRVSNLKDKEGKILQKTMNQDISSFEVDVVEETAQLFLVVFISLMYAGGLPVMVVLGAINIVSRYIANKYLILRYSKRIEGLTEDFSNLSIGILPIAMLISCLVAMWMFTASTYIYNTAMSVKIPFLDQYQNVFGMFPRVFYISYTLVLAVVILFYILFYNTVVRFFGWLGSLCYETKDTDQPARKLIPFSQATKTLNVLHSYNIHSNFKYKNTVLNLERYLEDE